MKYQVPPVLSPVLNAGPAEMKETWYLRPGDSFLIRKTFVNSDVDSSTICQNDRGIS